jgi:uncharacterized protein (DUF2267 family)
VTHVFDTELHEANRWIRQIADRLDGDDAVAKRALRGVLHALRDRIGADNAVHLAAQLPVVIRGMFFEGWRPHEPQSKERHKLDFLVHVDEAIGLAENPEPLPAVRAVFHVLWEQIDPGEGAKLMRMLPAELATWWPTGPDAVDRAARPRGR